MDLPEDEQRQLKQIEEQLAEEDPTFAARLTRKPPPHHRLSHRALFVVLLLLSYVVGLTLLVGGVALESVALIVLGISVTAIYPVLITVKGVRGKR